MELKIPDYAIDQAIRDSVKRAVEQSLNEDRWGPGIEFKKAIKTAIESNIPELEMRVATVFKSAISSPEFSEYVKQGVLAASKNLFTGTFDGVIKAAAKKAAQAVLTEIDTTELLKKIQTL